MADCKYLYCTRRKLFFLIAWPVTVEGALLSNYKSWSTMDRSLVSAREHLRPCPLFLVCLQPSHLTALNGTFLIYYIGIKYIKSGIKLSEAMCETIGYCSLILILVMMLLVVYIFNIVLKSCYLCGKEWNIVWVFILKTKNPRRPEIAKWVSVAWMVWVKVDVMEKQCWLYDPV